VDSAVYGLIYDIARPTKYCDIGSGVVSGGLVLVGGIGIGFGKCTYSDGRTRIVTSLEYELGMGVGVAATIDSGRFEDDEVFVLAAAVFATKFDPNKTENNEKSTLGSGLGVGIWFGGKGRALIGKTSRKINFEMLRKKFVEGLKK